MTFKVNPDQLLLTDHYRKDGKPRQVVEIFVVSDQDHGTFYQVVWHDHSLCGVDVFRPDDLIEVVQEFETKE